VSIATKELSIKTDLLEGLEKVIEGLVKKPPRYPRGPFLRGYHPDDPKSHHKYRACECDNTQINLFLKKLGSANLYPLSRLSQTETLKELLSRVEILISIASGKSLDYSDHHVKGQLDCDQCKSHLVSGMKGVESKAKSAFSGFCLDCVKQGEEAKSADTSQCRIPHQYCGYRGIDREWYGDELDSDEEVLW
jgi:hypothetical protein